MNHFKLNTISLALVTALVAPVAMAETNVYGKAHISVASIDDAAGSSIAISSHSSRFGVKGSVETEGSTEVFYKVEWQIDMTDDSAASDDHIKSRSQYIGVKDSWGTIKLGRDDSPYKKAGKKSIEFFSDTYADYNNIVDKGQDVRADSSMSYTVKAGPGKLSVMYAAGDDSTAAENTGDMTSLSYNAKFGSVVLAVATQTINKSVTNDETGTKLVIGYGISKATKVGFLFETVSDDLTLDDTNTLLSVKHKLGKDAVKFAYGFKDQGNANDATMLALAYDHKLNKSTTAYAIYADGADGGLNDSSKLAGDASVIGAGLVVKF